MKVVAVNGSHRADGNTFHAIGLMAETLAQYGVETEIIQLGNTPIRGCMGCGGCRNTDGGACIYNDDIVNAAAAKMKAADGIILGVPVHYAGIAGDMKSFLDRVFYSASKEFARKVAAGFVAVRRSGGVYSFDKLNHYFSIAGMMIAPSCYWNVIHGDEKGEVLQDLEGADTLRTVAANMAWLMEVLAKTDVPLPEIAPRRKTNFIR